MPDLNSTGATLAGQGLAWLDDDTIIGQRYFDDAWRVCTRAVSSVIWLSVSGRGCHMIAARAGHWLAFLDKFGVFGPDGLLWPSAALVGDIQSGRGVAAEDGTLGIVVDYQSGTGLQLAASDGSSVVYPWASLSPSVCVVNRLQALWWDWNTNQVQTCGDLPRPQIIPGAFGWPHALWLAGEWWIAYHSTDAFGAVLHPFNDATMGYRVAPVPAFYLTARALGPSAVKLAWGLDPAESRIGERIIDVATEPRVSLLPTYEPVHEIAPLPRPLWLGDFKAVGRDGDHADEALGAANLLCAFKYGDCDPSTVPTPDEICRKAAADARAHGAALAIGYPRDEILNLREDWDVVAAIWVSNEATGSDAQDGASVERQAASARATMLEAGLPLRPIVWYIDGEIAAPLRLPNGVQWMAVRGYLGPTSPATGAEAVRQLSALLERQLAIIPVDVPIVLICQSYDRNGAWTNINALMDMQPVYAEVARRDPRVIGIWRFAFARRGGVLTYPQLREWHRVIWRANSGRPVLETAPVPAPTPLPVPSPPVEVFVKPTYQQFLYDWPSAVTAEYQRVNGRDPALSDVMHGLWGILYEGQPVPGEPSPSPPSPSPSSRIGASYYTSLTDPRCDPVEFATRLQDAGCSFTRVWLIDAWAVGVNGIGQYEGFVPWEHEAGIFDLERVSGAYLDRLYFYVQVMNARGITPQLSGLELYSWSDRKQGMLWVPDANLGPFRRNRQGLRYADDSAFTNIATGGMHQFLEQFYASVVEMLEGLRFTVETGNEMPEKPLHYRLRDAWRRVGYVGPISVNRQDDTPGQYANMKIGQEFEDIAYHGKKTWAYLDEDFPREPTFRTFRQFYASGPDFSRITLSSDGARKSTNVEDAYDYAGLRDVARDSMARGGQYEHQLALKLRGFTHGRIDLNDIQYDLPLLKGLQR